MLERVVSGAPVFLLVAARCFALIMTIPLFSSRTVSRRAKVALTAYMSYLIFPQVSLVHGPYSAYGSLIRSDGAFNLEFIFLLIGEAMIGVIMGFYISIIFSAFSTAGQFFAFQMGFSASEVYDALSQVENPLMGQFLNFTGLLIFLQNHWFQQIFLGGLVESFKTINCFSIINNNDVILKFMLSSLSTLFADALVIALPLMGTLFLINVTMGILSKAAPTMNLLSEGFPILILTAFFIIALILPNLCELFVSAFVDGYKSIRHLLNRITLGDIV